MGRRRVALTIFLAGALLPAEVRILGGAHDAHLSLPFAAIGVTIGAVIWMRRGPE